MKRLKQSQILAYKKKLLEAQDYKCSVCSIDLREVPTRNICLDHDHTQGHVRGVLCRNCNGIEGKVHNLARRGARGRGPSDFLQRILAYWEEHATTDSESVYHPSHKTDEEKRLERNRKARLRNARKRALANVKGK